MSARAVRKSTRVPVSARVVADALGHGEAVLAGHHHVEQDQLRLPLARDLDGRRAVGRLPDGEAVGLQVDAAEQADRRLVVDHEDARAGHQATSRLCVAAGASLAGSSTTNVEPLPCSDSTQMRPPMAVTKPRTR